MSFLKIVWNSSFLSVAMSKRTLRATCSLVIFCIWNLQNTSSEFAGPCVRGSTAERQRERPNSGAQPISDCIKYYCTFEPEKRVFAHYSTSRVAHAGYLMRSHIPTHYTA